MWTFNGFGIPGFIHKLTIQTLKFNAMRKNIIQKLLVLSIIGVIGNANVSAATVKGSFLIAGEWYDGYLTSETITRTPSGYGAVIVTAKPPYRLKSLTGSLLKMSELRDFVAEFIEDKNYNDGGKIVPTNDGLTIISDDALDIKIYDLSGKCVYSATDVNNLYISKNTLNVNSGTYILHSVTKDGREERTTFIFDGSSFIIANPKE